MSEEIFELINKVIITKITNEELVLKKKTEHHNIFVINDNLWNNHKYKPTIMINKKVIAITMGREQISTYLKTEILESINKFDDMLTLYIEIYNKIQKYHNVKDIEKYIKIVYDIDIKKYNVYMTFYKDLFYCESDKRNTNGYNYSSREDVLMFDDMIYTNNIFSILLSKYDNILDLPINNDNLIYSTSKEINNIFTREGKCYKKNELFDAIQSYLNLTDDNCNILDPDFINDEIYIDHITDLCRMIKL